MFRPESLKLSIYLQTAFAAEEQWPEEQPNMVTLRTVTCVSDYRQDSDW
jgi:hypothetical protein